MQLVPSTLGVYDVLKPSAGKTNKKIWNFEYFIPRCIFLEFDGRLYRKTSIEQKTNTLIRRY